MLFDFDVAAEPIDSGVGPYPVGVDSTRPETVVAGCGAVRFTPVAHGSYDRRARGLVVAGLEIRLDGVPVRVGEYPDRVVRDLVLPG